MSAGEVLASPPPRTLNARPLGALFFFFALWSGYLAARAPALVQAISHRAERVRSVGWEVDWYSGRGCFASAKCATYLFAPLREGPLGVLGFGDPGSLLGVYAVFALFPAVFLLLFFFQRRLREAFKNYEPFLFLGGGLLWGGGFLLGFLGEGLAHIVPWIASLGAGILGGRTFPPSRFLTPYMARFASDTEVKDMLERVPGPHSVPLGEKRDGKGFYVVRPGTAGRRELQHVLVVAPTRSGKGLHLQTLAYTWAGSLVVVDIKGEMHRRTSGHRIRRGPVYVLDPTGDGHRFDPFAELQTDEEINSAVKLVLDTGDPENKIFEDRAAYAFIAMIAASRVRDAKGNLFRKEWKSTLDAVVDFLSMGSKRMLQTLEKEPFFTTALSSGDRWARKALMNARQFYGDGSDEKFRESSWNILASSLQALTTEGVSAMMSGSDFQAKDLVDAPATLYLRFPESELKATLSVLKLIEISLFKGIIRYIDGSLNGWSPNPILWAFDEAGAAPVPDLPNAVSTWAGRNMYALIYVQDLSQLEASYEQAGAETVLSNTLQVFYTGNPNQKTAEYVSQALGKLSQESASFTYSKESSESRSFVARELVTPDEFRQRSYPGADPEDVFILPPGRRAIWAKRVTPFGSLKVPKAEPVYPWKEPVQLSPEEGVGEG